MKCKKCKYYISETKYCKELRQNVKKKKSCWAFKEKTLLGQAFDFLMKRG